jgi:hypothetical protein
MSFEVVVILISISGIMLFYYVGIIGPYARAEADSEFVSPRIGVPVNILRPVLLDAFRVNEFKKTIFYSLPLAILILGALASMLLKGREFLRSRRNQDNN